MAWLPLPLDPPLAIYSPSNVGQEVDQSRGEIQIFKDFDGTLSVFHSLSPSNFLAKLHIWFELKIAMQINTIGARTTQE